MTYILCICFLPHQFIWQCLLVVFILQSNWICTVRQSQGYCAFSLEGYLTFCGRLHSHRIRNFSSTIDPTAKYNVALFKFIMRNFPIFLPMIGRCYGNTAVVACIPLVLSFFSSQRNVKCNCMWDRSFCHKLFLLDFE